MNLRESILEEIEKNIKLCSVCKGYGKVKAMQSVVTENGSIRGVNTQVECKHCNGTGRYVNS